MDNDVDKPEKLVFIFNQDGTIECPDHNIRHDFFLGKTDKIKHGEIKTEDGKTISYPYPKGMVYCG